MTSKAKKIKKAATKKNDTAEAKKAPEAKTTEQVQKTEADPEAPAKKKYKNPYEYKKVETEADVPGVGKIKVTLIEVEHNEEKFRCTTRKEAINWLRSKRSAERELKAAEREAKNANRINKSFPMVTARISDHATKIANLAEGATVNQDEKDLLNKVAEMLADCVIIRNNREVAEREAAEKEAAEKSAE